MGPNGCGKSTLASCLLASPEYEVTDGRIMFSGDYIMIHSPRNSEVRGGVFSFAFRGIHPHDVSQVLDEKNVCVRAGHHCAKPLMRLLGVNATSRASEYLYNDTNDIDALDGASDIFGL